MSLVGFILGVVFWVIGRFLKRNTSVPVTITLICLVVFSVALAGSISILSEEASTADTSASEDAAWTAFEPFDYAKIHKEGYKGKKVRAEGRAIDVREEGNTTSFLLLLGDDPVRVLFVQGEFDVQPEDKVQIRGVYGGIESDGVTPTIVAHDIQRVAKDSATSGWSTPEDAPPLHPPTMTKKEFLDIKIGMSYQEVVDIIGGEGELVSEMGEAGDEQHTISVMYDGEGKLGANASLIFQGGKLSSKTQVGLE